tara:strand:+ start:137 stop:529 length:393 start_codon:yes stop_codon:yes gene_type:complete
MNPKQRVNIQYSVDVDEVPDLLLQLLGNAVAKLEQTTAEAVAMYSTTEKQVTEYQSYNYGAETIDAIRVALADIDYRLSDCAMMLQGLGQLQNPPPEPTTTSTTDAIDKINQAAAMTATHASNLEDTTNE